MKTLPKHLTALIFTEKMSHLHIQIASHKSALKCHMLNRSSFTYIEYRSHYQRKKIIINGTQEENEKASGEQQHDKHFMKPHHAILSCEGKVVSLSAQNKEGVLRKTITRKTGKVLWPRYLIKYPFLYIFLCLCSETITFPSYVLKTLSYNIVFLVNRKPVNTNTSNHTHNLITHVTAYCHIPLLKLLPSV